MHAKISRLNPNQREAVLHPEGPLLILAGAGSGKTSTMASRIAHLIADRHVPPTAILGLSFTNKAAAELQERVKGLVRDAGLARAARGLTVTTFHSLCVRLLRPYAEKIGFFPNFTILDENDRRDTLRQVMRNVRIDERKFDLDTLLFAFGHAKGKLLDPENVEAYFLEHARLSPDYATAAACAFPRYQEQLRVLNGMDFDDLLYYGVRLLERHEDVRAHYNARFRHILVDEYQDTSPAQFRLLKALTERQQNLCVVGDDDQSIYSWRGAEPAHILEFSQHFPRARTIILDQNYRSTDTILNAANSVISNNRMRHPKRLWSEKGKGTPLTEIIVEDDRAEGEYIAESIRERAREQNRRWKDFAVLYRSNTQSRVFEEALRRHQIPYKIVGGLSFLERKEVKDLLSYWRLIVNPKDDASCRRILNWPARGIGKSAVENVGTAAFEKGISFFDALAECSTAAGKSAAGILSFRALIQSLRDELARVDPRSPEGWVAWGRMSLERVGVKQAIEAENPEDPAQAARKWENIEEILHSLGQFRPEVEGASSALPDSIGATMVVQEFLSRMMVEAREEEEDSGNGSEKDADQVTLLTFHGAKGLEFPVVYMVGLEEGSLPHQRTLDESTDLSEERRLCYVGITRAMQYLTLTRTRNRVRYGKPVPRLRSRFLAEIPQDLLVIEDRSHGPGISDPFESKDARKAHEEQVKGYLAGIRALLEQNKR